MNECSGYPSPRKLIDTVLSDAYGEYGSTGKRKPPRAFVNLMLVDDKAIIRLNRDYKGRDEATDVLAFEDGDEDPDTGLLNLGDIAVSVDTARREAGARKLRVRDEVTLYALHGLLHLLGFRDDTDKARAKMIVAQEKVFSRHGLKFDMA